MTTTSIRVSQSTQQKLKNIARQEQKSIGAVVEDFVADYERQAFRQQMQDDFTALRRDSDAWNDYQAEAELWDRTAGDGLENEPSFHDGNKERT